jgi:transglutaminase-like putative cysteine protease
MKENNFEPYLKPGFFINSDHPEVIKFTRNHTDDFHTIQQKIEALYYAVRDGFRYDPYRLDFSTEAVRASHLLTRDYGYCVEKSCLFAAGVRVLGVPSRMGFAKVRNHIGTAKLQEILQTDVLVFHGYAELWLNNRWIKATPVFNKSLCEKLNVAPLDFNGEDDAVFQSYNEEGGKFMEYLYDYGTYDDVPYELFISELLKHYPHLRDSILTTKKDNRIC